MEMIPQHLTTVGHFSPVLVYVSGFGIRRMEIIGRVRSFLGNWGSSAIVRQNADLLSVFHIMRVLIVQLEKTQEYRAEILGRVFFVGFAESCPGAHDLATLILHFIDDRAGSVSIIALSCRCRPFLRQPSPVISPRRYPSTTPWQPTGSAGSSPF